MRKIKLNTRRFGIIGEKIAQGYLKSQDYEILKNNFYTKKGEIDIVARDGEYLVFCEVKYRAGDAGGHPAEAVDLRKQKRISGCALYYMMEKGIDDIPCRFDVISICGKEIMLIKNAFDYIGG